MTVSDNAVAGVLVLYRPEKTGERAADIVARAAAAVDRLYAVDNSVPPALPGAPTPATTVIENGANLGLARALNQGMAAAREHGFRYALLLDQDSRIGRASVERLRETHAERADAFIVCPRVEYESGPRQETHDGIERVTPDAVRRVTVTISSGSLVDLSLLDRVGPHDEALFIDYVDFELCLRAAAQGLFTYRDDRAILHHRLGAQRETRFLGMRFHPTHHAPDRRYYKTRNMFCVWSRYWRRHPRWVMRSVRKLAAEFLQIWLFEDRKLRKTSACARGFSDFVMGRYGPRPSRVGADVSTDRARLRTAWRR